MRILRKSLDSRKRNQPLWRYSLEFEFAGELKHPKAARADAGDASQAPGQPAPAKYLPGERTALWALSALLESQLVEPFDPGHVDLVAQARERLREVDPD